MGQKMSLVNSKNEPGDLAKFLCAQRNYTLALYANLPEALWTPAQVPYMSHINPPLWELGHIAWFQEYFSLRLPFARSVGEKRVLPPSCSAFAEALLNSNTTAHHDRWTNIYPSRESMFAYMAEVLERVCEVAEKNPSDANIGLVFAHEFMHQEALAMTLSTLELPLPPAVPKRATLAGEAIDLAFAGGEIWLGKSGTSDDKNAALRFQFDNEFPAMKAQVSPFTIASKPLSGAAFAAFRQSDSYHDARIWSDEGNAWRGQNLANNRQEKSVKLGVTADENLAAMHINYFEAEAYCCAHNRRLPTEVEWEFAATHSPEFWTSVGHVWEWTASAFTPRPGFKCGVYQEYSAPWFDSHQVLRGASFVTHSLMKYPQYRNFYSKNRSDMFCGFRTCKLA